MEWAARTPQQRLINSLALAACATVMLPYGLAGLVYGHMHLFMMDHVVSVSGVPLVCFAVATWAMAAVFISHLLWRHTRWNNTYHHAWVRFACYALAIVLVLVAMACEVTPGEAGMALRKPRGWAPGADWLLAPMPVLWPMLVEFSSERYSNRAMLAGVVTVGLLVLFMSVKWVRGTFFCLGVVACLFATWLLGDAAFDYAAARFPQRFPTAGTLPRDFALNPGLENSGVFMEQCAGWWLLAIGWITAGAAVVMPPKVVDEMRRNFK